MAKKVLYLIFFLILLLGFGLRIYFVDKIIVGDLMSYAEWGEKFWQLRSLNYYFGQHIWTYSIPNYPPLAILVFAGIDWLWQHKFVLAQAHNLFKVPPAFFIIYFYKYGNILLLKLLPIISDLALGVVVFKAVLAISGKVKQALLGMAFFVLNPITIFISGAWGQTDSVVALIGILAFMLARSKWLLWSIPLFVLGVIFKPNWVMFAPFFAYVLINQKISVKKIFIGSLIAFALVFLVTVPFSSGNFFEFAGKLWSERFLIPLTSGNKVSVSAFNFFTIFYKVDIALSNLWLKGFGLLAYFILNYLGMAYFRSSKNTLLGVFMGLFIIGLGSFVFSPGMLERYFFPGMVPLVILMFSETGILLKGLSISLILFANIIWSFYRRGYNEIGNPFTDNNFLLIRILSLALTTLFVSTLLLLQSRKWKTVSALKRSRRSFFKNG